MSKPEPKPKSEESFDYSELASKVKDSAHLIWLAGLGAYIKAGKEGIKLFDNLVHDGKELDEFTRKKAVQVKEKANELTESAADEFKKIEDDFDKRVSETLSRIGLAGKDVEEQDMKELSNQITELSKAIEALQNKKK